MSGDVSPTGADRRRRPGYTADITKVGVLALQGDVREHLAAFRSCGVDSQPVRFAADLDAVDALALPGGESTTMSRLLRVFGLEEALRRRLDEGLPCFATCAGLILLSRETLDGRPDQLALGALDVSVRRNAYGTQVDSFEAPLDVTGLDAPFAGVFIRAPEIVGSGAGVEVIARHEGAPVAVAQGAHLAFAFHPEMTTDLRLHRLFLDRLRTREATAA